MSDDDDDETRVAPRRDMLQDEVDTLTDRRLVEVDDDAETRVANKIDVPAGAGADLFDDSITMKRKGHAPIRPAAGSRPGGAMPEKTKRMQPVRPKEEPPRAVAQPARHEPSRVEPIAPIAPTPPSNTPAPAEAPAPLAPSNAASPVVSVAAPAAPLVLVAPGPPRVFVIVLVACALFSATGAALLLYLKMRHLW